MRKEIRDKLPEIKKNIKEFVSDESGLVSKDKILKASFALGVGSILLSASVSAAHTSHTNELTASFSSQKLTGMHSHHGQHTSY